MKTERGSAERRSDAKGKQRQAIVQRAAAQPQGALETGDRSDAPAVSSEMRREMIATTAYFRAERRGFKGGDVNEDWLAAEAEVDVLIRERSKPAGRGKESRAALEKRLEAQLREWDKKLDELAAVARKAKTGARQEMEAQLETLAARRAALRDQLETLRRQTAHAWSDLREGIENAWEDMRKAVENIHTRFK